jgi:tetratricopeptide (TPR) repeat protein
MPAPTTGGLLPCPRMPLAFRHQVLLQARLELGLTQEQTAQALHVDVRTYRRYETGEVNDPTAGFELRRAGRRQLLSRIAEELGIAADELVEMVELRVPTASAELSAAPAPAPTLEPCLVHVLQPAQCFVGRTHELDTLRQWLAAPSDPVRIHAIVAVGGAGKSALVERLLDDLPAVPGRGVLVWSFYDDERPDAFLRAAVRYLGGVEPPAASLEALDRLLELVRAPAPHLLVLDGLETMQADGRTHARGVVEDHHLRRFLCTIAARPGGTRVLVTSRYPLVDLAAWEGQGVRTAMLDPLPTGAQLELLRGLGVQGTEARAMHALERFGGHALSVATLASYVSRFHDGQLGAIDSLDLGDAATDDPLAFRLARLLDAYATAMTPAQRDLVARVAAFPRGADVDALLALAREGGALAGEMPDTRRALVQALARLEAMGVVYRSRHARSTVGVHPFVAACFRDRLGAVEPAIHGAQRQRLLARLLERPSSVALAEQLDLLEELVLHTLLAEHVDEALTLYDRTMGGFGRLGLELGDMARGLRLLRAFLVDGDPDRPRAGLEPRGQRLVFYELALYATALGDPELALACLRHHVSLAQGDAREHTTGLRTTAYVLRLCGELDEALDTAMHACAIGAGSIDHEARNLALVGAIAHDRGDHEHAARCFARARALDPERRFRRGLWEAEHLADLGRYDEAMALVIPNREACLARGWAGHVSHCDVVLGTCCAAPDPERAAMLLQEARRWAQSSGEVEAELRCYELEARLAHDEDARHEVLERAQVLVRVSGAGRFERRLARR